MTIKEWLDKDNVIGQDIWHKKYQHNNESLDEWFNRTSGGNEELKKLIKEKKFLFGGRILANRGLQKEGRKISYSNCYVITPPEDSIESIFECATKLARTYSYGGGCGTDISKLAPRGSKINNAAKETTGAVSFMDLYSLVTELIGQNGRRGALMLSISCDHPDLEEFLNIKSDLNKVTKANISIKVTDDFLKAVKNDTDYELKFIRKETNEEITKTIRAKEFFHKFAEMNWKTAEPAFLFWDRITNWNLLSNTNEFEYAGTNPCFTGDMRLLTSEGYKTFEELNNSTFNIVNIDGDISLGKVWCSGEKDTIQLVFSNKKIITCTPDHRFMTIDGEECLAKNAKNKKIMTHIVSKYNHDKQYIKLGFIQGDGQLSRLTSQYHQGIEVNIGYKDGDIHDLFSDEKFETKSHRAIYLYNFIDKLQSLEFSKNTLPTREFPKTYISWTELQKSSFLNGCYSANGSIIKKHRISYKTTCKNFAEQLVSTLYDDFDIKAYITTNKAHNVEFSNGEYFCRESYDVNIYKFEDILKFNLSIGFYQQYKKIQLKQLINEKTPYVINIKENGKQIVYDFSESKTHWGIVNGLVAHNCAEEPLPAGGSCLLGSINLSEFVNNPFTQQASFNFDEFKKAVEIATIALNEVLDEGLLLHPLQEQRDSVKDWRQIGLGIMGLADMLIKMGITYGSEQGLELCDEIGFIMINRAIITSSILAEKYGAFPKCNIKEITSTDFFIDNCSTDINLEHLNDYGLRNSQLLTIAPTGTLSTMLGISGGIEPIFANYYERKTESLHDKEVSYKIYTPIVEQYMKQHHIFDDKNLPQYFVTSQTLNYKQRVDMQATWQKYIDASISSTVNLPNSFTVEEIKDLYMYAWKKGIKGITIYRAGCEREGILTTKTPKPNKNILQRGDVIQVDDDVIGRKRKLTTGCGSLHCTAFFDPCNGDLLETYLSKGSTGGCVNFMVGLSRLISYSSRVGGNIHDIVDQLNSCGVCPSYAVRKATKGDTSKGACCPIAIGNALLDMYQEIQYELGLTEEYEKDIRNTTSYKPCPQCGNELISENGCNICKSCGWSKCE